MKKKITIGIYAPSCPAHIWFADKYNHALKRIKSVGFNIIEGNLIKNKNYQGYRTAKAKMRAAELMELILNPHIDIIMPVIGGSNSASLIPFLDFDKMEKSKKIFCGYSDITALHLSILSKTTLQIIYGTAVIPTFGEYNTPLLYAEESFMDCLYKEKYELIPPKFWSNQLLDAFTHEWKKERQFIVNEGWKIINEGTIIGEVIALNISTLISLLGSIYIPDFSDKILILEEMDATISIEERNLNALKLAGIFDKISGLIFSKPEKYDNMNSNISYEALIVEIIGKRNYPIIYNFDCGHTLPSISIPQNSKIRVLATKSKVEIEILENSIIKMINNLV